MERRSAAALMKMAQTLAARGDDSIIELAETLLDLRALPKPPDGDRPTLDELVGVTKLSRRTICYLLKIRQTFSQLRIPRDRLARRGWTKPAVIAENSEPEDMEDALALAETYTAKELPALLKGAPPRAKARTVHLRLSPRQYAQLEAVLLANGARHPKKGRGLSGKGAGPIAARMSGTYMDPARLQRVWQRLVPRSQPLTYIRLPDAA